MPAKKAVPLKVLKTTVAKSSGIKTHTVMAATATAPAGIPAAPAGSACGCANGGTCVGCDGRCKCKTLFGCHFLGTLKQKRVAVGILVTFVLLAASHMALYRSFTMPNFNYPVLLGTDLVLATTFTILFSLAQKFGSVWEGLRLGALLILPMAAASFLAGVNHPNIPSAVVSGIALTTLTQGAILGVVLALLGRCSCLSGKWFGGCGKSKAKAAHTHKHGGGCC